MTKPITPNEVVAQKVADIPDSVILVWNEAITKFWKGHRAIVKQNYIVQKLNEHHPDVERSEIYEIGWLNIETMFEQAGWKVSYDKPGYDETYDAYFEFTKAKPRLQ